MTSCYQKGGAEIWVVKQSTAAQALCGHRDLLSIQTVSAATAVTVILEISSLVLSSLG